VVRVEVEVLAARDMRRDSGFGALPQGRVAVFIFPPCPCAPTTRGFVLMPPGF